MKSLVTNLINIFNSLIKNPDKDYKIAEILKDTLNREFKEEGYICKHVFISKGNNVNPYVVNVIPIKCDASNILEVEKLASYDIDIDMDYLRKSFDEFDATAWLLHELISNVITDSTFIRYKKLIIHYYDINSINILNTIDILGKLLWIGVFGRTKKDYSNVETSVNQLLKQYGVDSHWDSALSKYIDITGGSHDVISESYINRMDKIQLVQFNKLARAYSTYVIKYNNKDYEIFIKYLMATTNSKLVEYYAKNEPEQMITFKEKDSFKLFNDTKILLENAVDEFNNDTYIKDLNTVELLKEFDEIKLNISNIETVNDKLLASVKLKDLLLELNKRIKETNSELLSITREEAMNLISKLDDKISYDAE